MSKIEKMTDDNWLQVRKIFDDALHQKPEERQKFVAEACGNNKLLLAEVESLLKSLESSDSFMETPAVAKVADVIEAEQRRIESGVCFGHYEIIKQIGVGGMGEVYLALDKKLDRQVAVKILNEKFSQHESNLRRFVSEAKAASALNHPNILTIYEFGEAEDAHFIVSEYVEGKTLREILRESKLKLAEILDISIQIAGALSAAHQAHLVHRDIKPENIMVRPDGYVKVLDFGLAKLIQPRQALAGLEAETAKQSETAKGVIMGTINYMSPEQAKGEKVDERTDIFSFGVVIYEMLTTRTPFQGNSVSETFANLINAEPQPIERFAANVPLEFQRMVLKMLSKEKTERYSNLNELSTELKNLLENFKSQGKLDKSPITENETLTQIPAVTKDETKNLTLQNLPERTGDVELASTNRALERQPKYRALSAIGLIMIVALTGIAYGLYRYAGVGNSPLSFKEGKTTRLTSSGRVKDAVVSPDGKFVIYSQEENNDQQSLWMQHIGSESNVQIVSPAKIEYRSLNISPDSNSLYYHDAKGILYRMAVLGGTPKKIAEGLFTITLNEKISISPDGNQIGFVRKLENGSTTLFRANNDGTNEQVIASFELPNKVTQWSAWSPDGKTIACRLNNAEGQNVAAVRVADGIFAPILQQGWVAIVNVTWLPDSKSLFALGLNPNDETVALKIWQVSYPGGEPRQITSDTNDYSNVSITSDGHSLVVVRKETAAQIWTAMNEEGNSIHQLTSGFEKLDGTMTLNWMPNDKIIFNSTSSGKFSGWVIKPGGGNPQQLVKDELPVAISPDGRNLLFSNGATDGFWRRNLEDGSEQQLTNQVDVWTTFSPDGKWVVFLRYADKVGLWKIPIEGGDPTLIFQGQALSPAVSPDGKKIAFIFTKNFKISLISFDGGEIIKTFDATPQMSNDFSKMNLQWTPDGKAINYVAINNGVSNIWRQPITGGAPFQMTKFDSGRIFNFAYSPDGKQLALSRGSLNSDVVLIKNSE